MSISLIEELLSVLSKKELTECKLFIIRHNKSLVNSFEKSLQYLRKEDNSSNENKKPKSKNQRIEENRLKNLIEEYFVITQDSSYIKKDKVLLRIFKDRRADRNYTLKLNKLRKELIQNNEEDHLKYRTLFEVELLNYEQELSQKNNREADLSKVIQYSDEEIIIEKLKQACMLVSQRNIVEKEYNIKLINLIIDYVDSDPSLMSHPLISIYFCSYKMIANNDEVYFESCMQALQNVNVKYTDDIYSNIYTLGINFCIRRLNAGDKVYGLKGLELSRRNLNNDSVKGNANLSIYKYRNIVMMAIRCEEYHWAEEFCNDFRDKLDNKDKESYYAYNMAVINYYKHDYDLAIDYINSVNSSDVLFVLSLRVLQMKIYYESNEWNVLSYHLDAMKVYLYRQKLLGYPKKNYENIVKIVKALMKLDGSQRQKEKLRLRIEKMEPLTEKKWILDQIS